MTEDALMAVDAKTSRRRSLMSPDELAEYLGVSIHCVYAWSCRGEGPPVLRVGSRLRYRPRDVEAWLDSRTSVDAG